MSLSSSSAGGSNWDLLLGGGTCSQMFPPLGEITGTECLLRWEGLLAIEYFFKWEGGGHVHVSSLLGGVIGT